MFTLEELIIIYDRVRFRKTIDELCLIVYLLMTTNLKMRDLLGWFNYNLNKRRKFLQDPQVLEEYELVRILFPKKHQTYLLQWKRACRCWIGKEKNVTFERLRNSCKREKSKLAFIP